MIDALQSAIYGLQSAQQLLNVTGANAANAQTAGYTRKSIALNSVVAGSDIIGTTYGNLQRTVDKSLQSSYWTQLSTSAGLATTNSYLSKVQTFYGTSDAQSSFAATLTNLQNTFTALSSQPDSTINQQQVIGAAKTFSSAVNQTASTLTQLRNNTQTDIASSVATINGELSSLGKLNQSIANEQAGGRSTANLEDQRDQTLQSLAQQMTVSYYKQSNGMITVQDAQGQPLVDGVQVHQLVFSPQTLSALSYYPSTVGGVYIDSTTGKDLAATKNNPGGTLGALISLRDQVLPQQQAQLDELAQKTATRFSAQNLNLFTDSAGTIPVNTPTAYAGFASVMTVNSAVIASPGLVQQGTSGPALQPGDNSVINNILTYTFGLNSNSTGTPNTPFNTTSLGASGSLTVTLPSVATLQGYAQQIISSQADQASQTQSQQTYSDNYRDSLQKQVLDGSAVSLDTELSNLTVYQNAYGASAQVLKTAEELMQTLLNSISGA